MRTPSLAHPALREICASDSVAFVDEEGAPYNISIYDLKSDRERRRACLYALRLLEEFRRTECPELGLDLEKALRVSAYVLAYFVRFGAPGEGDAK